MPDILGICFPSKSISQCSFISKTKVVPLLKARHRSAYAQDQSSAAMPKIRRNRIFRPSYSCEYANLFLYIISFDLKTIIVIDCARRLDPCSFLPKLASPANHLVVAVNFSCWLSASRGPVFSRGEGR